MAPGRDSSPPCSLERPVSESAGAESAASSPPRPMPQRAAAKEFASELPVPSAHTHLSNDMTGRDMIAVGVRNVVLARGTLDKLEGPKYAERRAELRRKAREAARARDRQTTAASQNEAEESDESGEETAGERTTRVGRTRGGMKVAARIGEKLRREIREQRVSSGELS